MEHALPVVAIESSRRVIEDAFEEFGPSLAVVTSFQREGLVIVDLAMKISRAIPIMTIDTGRLPAATSGMIGTVERRYDVVVERILPDPDEVDSMVRLHGLDLFREGVPQRMLCCNVRKVRPLSSRLRQTGAYFTGMRRGQSESRGHIETVDRSGSPVKISPLADWTPADVAAYSERYNLPEHPLYAAGYRSIGCEPCTRATNTGEDERAGRWWWEGDAAKECGLHFSPDGRVERTVDVLLRDLLTGAHA